MRSGDTIISDEMMRQSQSIEVPESHFFHMFQCVGTAAGVEDCRDPWTDTINEIRTEGTYGSNIRREILCVEERNKARDETFYEEFLYKERIRETGLMGTGIFMVLNHDADNRVCSL